MAYCTPVINAWQGGSLGYAELRTTGFYDRQQKKVTRNIAERISI
jgi:uncharacterized protein YutD